MFSYEAYFKMFPFTSFFLETVQKSKNTNARPEHRLFWQSMMISLVDKQKVNWNTIELVFFGKGDY